MSSPQCIADVEKHVLETIASIKTVSELSDDEIMKSMRGFFTEHNKDKVTVIRKQTASEACAEKDAHVEELQTIALCRQEREKLHRPQRSG